MRRFLALAAGLLLLCAGSAWLAGCPATTILGVAPITAISVPISTLLSDSSLGCGFGPDDVYKYAVVIQYQTSASTDADGGSAGPYPSFDACPGSPRSMFPLAGAVFDCFATATFGNLPLEDAGGILTDSGGALPDGGKVTIVAWVSFYNYATYNKVGRGAIDKAIGGHDGGICAIGATWTTTCVATEQDNIVSNASCGPLVLGSSPPNPDAAVIDGAAGDAPGDGPAAEAAPDSPTEAASEASTEAGTDAGTDAATDAHLDAPPG